MPEGTIVLGQDTTGADLFDRVFTEYHDYVYRLAHALLGHPQDAEDLTQEVFLRVYRALPSYRPERAGLRINRVLAGPGRRTPPPAAASC